MMDIEAILKLLPHRSPFLLVDRILEFVPLQRVVALKNVTIDEPFFQGHFPGKPVMPGVLILESLAQAAGVLAYESARQANVLQDLMFYFAGIDRARFRRMVIPGDQLRLYVDVIKSKKGIWKFDAKATVDGEIACVAELMCAGIREGKPVEDSEE